MAATPPPGQRPTTSTPSPWPRVAVGAVVVVVGVLTGLLVTAVGAANTGELGLDVTLSQHRIPALTWLSQAIDVVAGTRVAPVLLLLASALIWVRARAGAATLALLTAVGWLSVQVGKVLVHRPRPPSDTVHALVVEQAADSYPSGHTAFAAAVLFAVLAALTLHRRSRRGAMLVGLPLVALVGASRMYLGAHYLADVAASVAFAGGTILAVFAVAKTRLTRLTRPQQPVHDQAGPAETGRRP